MESRISRIFLKLTACLLLMSSTAGYGESPADPSVADDSQFTENAPILGPFIVRRAMQEADIDTENIELGIYVGQIGLEELTTVPLFGVNATYHATEDLFLEMNYAVATLDTPNTSKLDQSEAFTDDDLVMYNLSLGINLFPGEVFLGEGRAFNAALYVIAGGGVTQFDDKDEFTVNFGVGYRIVLTDWMAFHMDLREHIFSRTVAQAEKKSQNLDFHTGVSFFF